MVLLQSVRFHAFLRVELWGFNWALAWKREDCVASGALRKIILVAVSFLQSLAEEMSV